MLFPGLWWMAGLMVVVLYLIGHYLSNLEGFAQVGLYEIDRMSKKDFQCYCGLLLRKVGYRVYRPKRAKSSVSFIVEKEGLRLALIVKQYTNQVNIRPVEKAAEGARKNNCSQAVVLTNREFSCEARKRAQELGVELWDRDKLADLLIAART